jgi:hypothetical protein
MTYDPNDDWVPPKPIHGDDILVDDAGPGGLGRNQPFWKVLLWHTARARTEMRRADSAVAAEPSTLWVAPSDQLTPRLAADRVAAIDADVLEAVEQAIDDLTARLDRYERRMAAEAALTALEDEIDRLSPPSQDDETHEPVFEPGGLKH